MSGQLDGAPLPESAEANSALNGMGQNSAAGQLLKSPGVLEALKNQAIHDKTESEPVSGAPVFNDPNDLNQVDPR